MDSWTMHDYNMKVMRSDPSRFEDLSRELNIMKFGP